MAATTSTAGAVVAAAVALESARRARRGIGDCEQRVFRVLNDAPDALQQPAWFAMQAGSLGAVFAASAVLERQGRHATSTVTALAGTGVWVGVKLVKPLVGRPRPAEVLDRVVVRGTAQTGLGYPSGHAAVAVAIALVAGRDVPASVRGAATVVAGLTSAARVYVGAHLPLDVAGGAAIGVLGARVARTVVSRRGR